MKTYSFSINEIDDSVHVATISGIPYGDIDLLRSKIITALTERYDSEIEIMNCIPSDFFDGYSPLINVLIVDSDLCVTIKFEQTHVY